MKTLVKRSRGHMPDPGQTSEKMRLDFRVLEMLECRKAVILLAGLSLVELESLRPANPVTEE